MTERLNRWADQFNEVGLFIAIAAGGAAFMLVIGFWPGLFAWAMVINGRRTYWARRVMTSLREDLNQCLDVCEKQRQMIGRQSILLEDLGRRLVDAHRKGM